MIYSIMHSSRHPKTSHKKNRHFEQQAMQKKTKKTQIFCVQDYVTHTKSQFLQAHFFCKMFVGAQNLFCDKKQKAYS